MKVHFVIITVIITTLTLSYTIIFSQSKTNAVQFVPDTPASNESVKLFYKPEAHSLKHADKIIAVVHFTGENDYPQAIRIDFPLASEVPLRKNNDSWETTIGVPNRVNGIVIVFMDSLGNVDNNGGEGYWTPIFNKNKIIPGALSSIADLYAGGWDPKSTYKLDRKLDLAKRLYEEEFAQHPEMKRKFIRYYLATFNLNISEDLILFKDELKWYTTYDDLDEWDLKAISEYYGRINYTQLAEKYSQLVFEKYPKGSWVIQTNSLKLAMSINKTDDFAQKIKLYKQFKETYKDFPDEFTRRVMTGRKSQILSQLVVYFAREGTMDAWLKEVEELDDEFKYSAYRRAIWELLKINGREGNTSQKVKETFSEHPFLRYDLPSDQAHPTIAEALARDAVNWWKANINAPRRHNEPPFMTDSQVQHYRQVRIGEMLDLLGQSLFIQNKYEEASNVLREAVLYSKKNDAEINEHFIGSLVKAGDSTELMNEIQEMILNGKSTEVIDEFFFKTSQEDFRKLKKKSAESLKEILGGQLINENAPEFELKDLKGNVINSKMLKGKVAVLDFWATWCPPCIEGLKVLEHAAEMYEGNKDVVFLFLNVEKNSDRAIDFLKGKENDHRYVFTDDRTAFQRFSITGLPTKILIDCKGRIRFRSVGLNSFNAQEQIDEIVGMIEIIKNESCNIND